VSLQEAERLLAEGNVEQARRVLRATLLASKLSDEAKADVYACLAQVEIARGQATKALSMLERCRQLRPDHPQALLLAQQHDLTGLASRERRLSSVTFALVLIGFVSTIAWLLLACPRCTGG
jgi:outer membrane PBP1 activator LpoA protein